MSDRVPKVALTERSIQDALWTRLRLDGHHWMCPNYTPKGWWECDMFSLTKAGRFVEHEIKLTLSDFRADRDKVKTIYQGRGMGWEKRGKHTLLANNHAAGPSRFFYIAPEGLLTPDMLPEWAGLITVQGRKEGLHFFQERPAIKLHNEAVDEKVIEHLRGIFYWRFWSNRNVRDPGGVADYEI